MAHSCSQKWKSHSFLWQSDTPLCIYTHITVFLYIYIHTPHFLYPFIYWWHLECFCISAILNNATMSIGVHISFIISVFVFFEETPKSRITGFYGSSVFNFLRNLRTLIHINCTNFDFHQQRTHYSLLSTPSPTLYFVFLMIAILTGKAWHLIWLDVCFDLHFSDD